MAAEPISAWASVDTERTALASLFPLGVSAYRSIVEWRNRKDIILFAKSGNSLPRFCAAMNMVTASPLGYASYLVWKKTEDIDPGRVRYIFGLYGFTLMNSFTLAKMFKQQKKYQQSVNENWTCAKALVLALTSAATAYSFHKLDRTAGYLMIPFTIWNACYAVLWVCHDYKSDHCPAVSSCPSQTNLFKPASSTSTCQSPPSAIEDETPPSTTE